MGNPGEAYLVSCCLVSPGCGPGGTRSLWSPEGSAGLHSRSTQEHVGQNQLLLYLCIGLKAFIFMSCWPGSAPCPESSSEYGKGLQRASKREGKKKWEQNRSRRLLQTTSTYASPLLTRRSLAASLQSRSDSTGPGGWDHWVPS